MITRLYFSHLGEEISSDLVFNFSAVRDVMLIIPRNRQINTAFYNPRIDFGILYHQTSRNEWTTKHHGILRYPETFRELNEQLEKYFYKQHFQFNQVYEA